MEMIDLEALWASLGNTPTREAADGTLLIDEDFHSFKGGTSCEEIWMWFEGQNPAFSVAQQMGVA